MKRFEQHELRAAVAYAAAGGQALHVCRSIALVGPDAPKCFQRSEMFAHLFDQDAGRARATAAKLGVRVVYLDRAGDPGQHVDLCGGPLARALVWCEALAAQDLQGTLPL